MYTTDVFLGDSQQALQNIEDKSVNLIITSPPYANARRRHYDSIAPKDYVDFILSFHDQLWRVLADDGSFILNIKDRVVNGVRNRFVWHTIESLAEKGWLCIDDYVCIKPYAMPVYLPNRYLDQFEY